MKKTYTLLELKDGVEYHCNEAPGVEFSVSNYNLYFRGVERNWLKVRTVLDKKVFTLITPELSMANLLIGDDIVDGRSPIIHEVIAIRELHYILWRDHDRQVVVRSFPALAKWSRAKT